MSEPGSPEFYENTALLRYLCDVKGLITQEDIDAIDKLARSMSDKAKADYEEMKDLTPKQRERRLFGPELTVVDDE